MTRHATIAVVVLLAGIAPAAAQTPSRAAAAGPGRFDVSAGPGWFTGSGLGDESAELRGRDGTPYQLFATESRMGAGPLVEARIGYALTRRYTVEARFGYSRPELRTDVSADVEGAPALTAVERLDRYVVDGALLVHVADPARSRFAPFLSAGAGYLRELHEGRTLVEQGIGVHAGGGVKHAFFTRMAGAVTSLGVRGDARVVFLSGAAGGDAAHVAISVSLFLGF